MMLSCSERGASGWRHKTVDCDRGRKRMTAETMELESGRRMRGLDRAVEILDYLPRRRRPARPNEIAVGLSAPKSTTYELVNLLLKAGMVEYADKEGRVF